MSSVGLRPLGNRVLIKRLEPESALGSFFIPEACREKKSKGIVVAVGPGRITSQGHLIEPLVKTGDLVLFGTHVGQEIKIGDDEHTVLVEDDILGVEMDGE